MLVNWNIGESILQRKCIVVNCFSFESELKLQVTSIVIWFWEQQIYNDVK